MKLLIAYAGSALLASYPAAASDMEGCFANGLELVRDLREVYGQHMVHQPGGSTWPLATYRSRLGTWTVVAHRPDGSACVLYSGG